MIAAYPLPDGPPADGLCYAVDDADPWHWQALVLHGC